MRDSGVEWIGEIPAHWEVTRLKYVFSETNERTKTGQEVLFSLRMEQGLVPHNDVSDKQIADDNLIDYKIIRPGQMIMNRMRAAIGIFGLADKFGLVSPDYAVFNIGQNAFPEYFLRLFKTPLIGEQFRLNSKGLGTGSSGFMRLYTESFGDIKIPLPPRAEQASIVDHIETQSTKIDQAIAIQQQQIDKLKEYKATLINSAVTGKIRVPEVAA
jgi:type I restriction enzyme S subunit